MLCCSVRTTLTQGYYDDIRYIQGYYVLPREGPGLLTPACIDSKINSCTKGDRKKITAVYDESETITDLVRV